jgi:hypothetical protein
MMDVGSNFPAQLMAQPLPPISQVLREIHPRAYSRSEVSTPPTMTGNPSTGYTTGSNISSVAQTLDLKGALGVVG